MWQRMKIAQSWTREGRQKERQEASSQDQGQGQGTRGVRWWRQKARGGEGSRTHSVWRGGDKTGAEGGKEEEREAKMKMTKRDENG